MTIHSRHISWPEQPMTAVSRPRTVRHGSLESRIELLAITIVLLVLPFTAGFGRGDEDGAVQRAVAALQGKDAKTRAEAARELGRLGSKAKDAIPALIETLGDGDRIVRVRAATALSQVGGPLKLALPVLLANQNNPDEATREEARAVWDQIGPGVRATVLYLPEVLRREAAQGQQKAIATLGEHGLVAAPALIDILKLDYAATSTFNMVRISPQSSGMVNAAGGSNHSGSHQTNGQLRTVAVAAIGGLGPEVIPTLLVALHDRSPLVREGAVQALASLGSNTTEVLAPLAAALQDRDTWVRQRAVEALASANPSPVARKALADALEHKDTMVRRAVVQALTTSEIGRKPANVTSMVPNGMMRVNEMALNPGMTPFSIGPAPASGPLDSSPVDASIIPALTAALSDPDSFVRVKAAEALIRSTPPAQASVRTLLEALTDRDEGTRQLAGQVLLTLGPRTREIAPHLRELTEDPDPFVRLIAARALSRAGAAEKENALRALRSLLEEDAPSRFHAAETLWEMGQVDEAIPVLIAAFDDSQSRGMNILGIRAREILQRVGPTTKAVVPALVDALKSENPNTRRQVLEILQRLGTAAADAAPAVVVQASSNEKDLNFLALGILRQLGTLPKQVIPDILAMVKESDPAQLGPRLPLLQQFGPETKAAIPVLAGFLNHPTPRFQIQAIEILQQVASQAPAESVPVLIEALKHKDSNIRSRAASALAQLGAQGAPAAAALAELLNDPDVNSRLLAIQALEQLGPAAKGTAPALVKALRDENHSVRLQASQALRRVDRKTRAELEPALLEMLQDQNSSIRSRALAVLTSNVDRKSRPPLLAALLRFASDSEPNVRLQAVHALGRLSGGGLDRQITPALKERLADSSDAVRLAAAQVLASAPTRSAEFQAALQTLVALLQAAPSSFRIQVSATLEMLGLRAREALPALTARLGATSDRASRFLMATALAQLGREGRKAALPVLLDLAKAGPATNRFRALRAIQQLGTAESQLTVPLLLEQLRTSPGVVPNQPIQAIVQLGPAAAELIPELVERLRTGDAGTRSQAATALGSLGPTATKAAEPVLIELIRNDKNLTRNQAVGLIRALPNADIGPAIPDLMKGFNELDRNAQLPVILLLGKLGPPARAAVPALRTALKNQRSSSRLEIARSLWQITGDERPLLLVLEEELRSPQTPTKLQAARFLAEKGSHGRTLALPTLLDWSNSTDPSWRSHAILGFAHWPGLEITQALPGLIAGVNHPDPASHNLALAVLTRLGPAARGAVPALAARLTWPANPPASPALVQALGALGPDAVPALTTALKTAAPDLRGDMIEALGRLGPAASSAVPALIEVLRSGEANGNIPLRPKILAALFSVGLPAVPHLVECLDADDLALRQDVAQLLGRFEAGAKEAIPSLRRALNDHDIAWRVIAAGALRRIGGEPESTAVLPVLAAGLKHDDHAVRRAATMALARITPLPPDLASDLTTVLNNGDPLTRLHAAAALARMPGRTDEAIVELVDALDSPFLRSSAIKALVDLGPTVQGAVPHLADRLEDANDGPTAGQFADALARIAGERAVEPLLTACTRADSQARPAIVNALAQTGPTGIPALIQLAADDQPETRLQAVQSLGSIANDQKTAGAMETALRKALSDPVPAIRLEASIGLADRGHAADPAVVAPIVAAAKDHTVAEHPRAVEALGHLGAAAAPALPTLAWELTIDEGTTRLRAVEALGRVGPPAREAAPMLERLLSHPDLQTRTQAAIALWAIGGDDRAAASALVLTEALRSPGFRPLAIEPGESSPYFVFPSSPPTSAAGLRNGNSLLESALPTPTVLSDPAALHREVIKTLGRLKRHARVAMPALRYESQEADPLLRAAAESALVAIEAAGTTVEEPR